MNSNVTPEQVEALIEVLPGIERDYPEVMTPMVQHLRRLHEAIETQLAEESYGVVPLKSVDIAVGLGNAIKAAIIDGDSNPDRATDCMDRITEALSRADVRTRKRVEAGLPWTRQPS